MGFEMNGRRWKLRAKSNICSTREICSTYLIFSSILIAGNVSQSHSSQGVMALVVMLIVLCLLIMYCCWGGCCKLIRRRRRISRSLNSAGSCSSYPNVVVLPYRGGIYDLQDPSSRRNGVNRPRSAKDSHGRMNPLPPPPYETLFGNESCNPPSYSSVCLPALDALHPPALSQAVVNQAPAPCDHLSGEVAAESSISQAPVGGSDPTPACVVAVDIERSIATNDLHNVDHSRGSLPEATARIPRCLSVPSSIGGSPHLVSAPSTVNLEV